MAHQYIYIVHENTDIHGWQYRSQWPPQGIPNPHDEQWSKSMQSNSTVRRRIWMTTIVPRIDLVRVKRLLSDNLRLDQGAVRFQGELLRYDPQQVSWQKRRCILFNNRVEFYDANNQKQGELPLDDCEVRMLFENQCPGKKTAFSVRHPNGQGVLLDAGSKEDRRQWVLAIQYQMATTSDDLNHIPLEYGPPTGEYPDNRVSMCGDLKLCDRDNSTWLPRHFQLLPREMVYFDETDNLKGRIFMENAQVITGGEGSAGMTGTGNLRFTVQSASGIQLQLSTDNPESRSLWLQGVRKEVDRIEHHKAIVRSLPPEEAQEPSCTPVERISEFYDNQWTAPAVVGEDEEYLDNVFNAPYRNRPGHYEFSEELNINLDPSLKPPMSPVKDDPPEFASSPPPSALKHIKSTKSFLNVFQPQAKLLNPQRKMLNPRMMLSALQSVRHRFVLVLESEHLRSASSDIHRVAPARFTVGGPRASKDPRTLPLSQLVAVSQRKPEVQLPSGWLALHPYIYITQGNTDDDGWQYRSNWSQGVLSANEEQWSEGQNKQVEGQQEELRVRRRLWMVTVVRREDIIAAKVLATDEMKKNIASAEPILQETLWVLSSADLSSNSLVHSSSTSNGSPQTNGNWQKRKVMLYHDRLDLFNGPDKKGDLLLSDYELHILTEKERQVMDRSFPFVLYHRKGYPKIVFDADSHEMQLRWVKALGYQLAITAPDLNFSPFPFGPPTGEIAEQRVLLGGSVLVFNDQRKGGGDWEGEYFLHLLEDCLELYQRDTLCGRLLLNPALNEDGLPLSVTTSLVANVQVKAGDEEGVFILRSVAGWSVQFRCPRREDRTAWVLAIKRQLIVLEERIAASTITTSKKVSSFTANEAARFFHDAEWIAPEQEVQAEEDHLRLLRDRFEGNRKQFWFFSLPTTSGSGTGGVVMKKGSPTDTPKSVGGHEIRSVSSLETMSVGAKSLDAGSSAGSASTRQQVQGNGGGNGGSVNVKSSPSASARTLSQGSLSTSSSQHTSSTTAGGGGKRYQDEESYDDDFDIPDSANLHFTLKLPSEQSSNDKQTTSRVVGKGQQSQHSSPRDSGTHLSSASNSSTSSPRIASTLVGGSNSNGQTPTSAVVGSASAQQQSTAALQLRPAVPVPPPINIANATVPGASLGTATVGNVGAGNGTGSTSSSPASAQARAGGMPNLPPPINISERPSITNLKRSPAASATRQSISSSSPKAAAITALNSSSPVSSTRKSFTLSSSSATAATTVLAASSFTTVSTSSGSTLTTARSGSKSSPTAAAAAAAASVDVDNASTSTSSAPALTATRSRSLSNPKAATANIDAASTLSLEEALSQTKSSLRPVAEDPPSEAAVPNKAQEGPRVVLKSTTTSSTSSNSTTAATSTFASVRSSLKTTRTSLVDSENEHKDVLVSSSRSEKTEENQPAVQLFNTENNNSSWLSSSSDEEEEEEEEEVHRLSFSSDKTLLKKRTPPSLASSTASSTGAVAAPLVPAVSTATAAVPVQPVTTAAAVGAPTAKTPVAPTGGATTIASPLSGGVYQSHRPSLQGQQEASMGFNSWVTPNVGKEEGDEDSIDLAALSFSADGDSVATGITLTPPPPAYTKSSASAPTSAPGKSVSQTPSSGKAMRQEEYTVVEPDDEKPSPMTSRKLSATPVANSSTKSGGAGSREDSVAAGQEVNYTASASFMTRLFPGMEQESATATATATTSTTLGDRASSFSSAASSTKSTTTTSSSIKKTTTTTTSTTLTASKSFSATTTRSTTSSSHGGHGQFGANPSTPSRLNIPLQPRSAMTVEALQTSQQQDAKELYEAQRAMQMRVRRSFHSQQLSQQELDQLEFLQQQDQEDQMSVGSAATAGGRSVNAGHNALPPPPTLPLTTLQHVDEEGLSPRQATLKHHNQQGDGSAEFNWHQHLEERARRRSSNGGGLGEDDAISLGDNSLGSISLGSRSRLRRASYQAPPPAGMGSPLTLETKEALRKTGFLLEVDDLTEAEAAALIHVYERRGSQQASDLSPLQLVKLRNVSTAPGSPSMSSPSNQYLAINTHEPSEGGDTELSPFKQIKLRHVDRRSGRHKHEEEQKKKDNDEPQAPFMKMVKLRSVRNSIAAPSPTTSRAVEALSSPSKAEEEDVPAAPVTASPDTDPSTSSVRGKIRKFERQSISRAPRVNEGNGFGPAEDGHPSN
eukprot:scaffold3799_cov168-Ochromonas_danica.AAC.3